MKTILLVFVGLISAQMPGLASVSDPIADFKTKHRIAPCDKIIKWTCNVSKDNKSDVLLCLKSDFDKNSRDNEPQSWSYYIANASGNTYTKSTGTSQQADSLSVDDMPKIDTGLCFVGLITELNKRGIVGITYATPRSGVTTATIFAYTVEGDHLKRTQLAQFDPDKASNPVFNKYLADNKRSNVTLQEITP